jgi:polyphenol oxidase
MTAIHRFHLLEKHHIPHFIATRLGGVSQPPWSALNISYQVGDEIKTVTQNRILLSNVLLIDLYDLIFCQQVHGNKIALVDESSLQNLALPTETSFPKTDGLITLIPRKYVAVIVADCVPVLFVDLKHQIVGAIHAGRRGIESGIIQVALHTLHQEFGCFTQDLLVCIGPSIRSCCYFVDSETTYTFTRSLKYLGIPFMPSHYDSETNRYSLDLQTAVKTIFLQAGVNEEHIEIMAVCTSCNTDLFFSHRKENGITGRFAIGISPSYS